VSCNRGSFDACIAQSFGADVMAVDERMHSVGTDTAKNAMCVVVVIDRKVGRMLCVHGRPRWTRGVEDQRSGWYALMSLKHTLGALKVDG